MLLTDIIILVFFSGEYQHIGVTLPVLGVQNGVIPVLSLLRGKQGNRDKTMDDNVILYNTLTYLVD